MTGINERAARRGCEINHAKDQPRREAMKSMAIVKTMNDQPRRRRWFRRVLGLIGYLAMGLAAATTGHAATFSVNSILDEQDDTPGDGDCLSNLSGVCTLRAAIQETNALAGDDEINIAVVGTIKLKIPGPGEDTAATGDLDITDNLTITGDSYRTTIIDGNRLDRVFEIHPLTMVEMGDVTIKNGKCLDDGGGIANRGDLQLSRVLVEGNSANGGGGGIFNDSGLLETSTSIVKRNTSVFGNGGGIYNNSGDVVISQSIVSANKAGNYGGGLSGLGGALEIFASVIEGNNANPLAQGGGVHWDGESMILFSRIKRNSAGTGGGLAIGVGPALLQLVQVEGNNAKSNVGGGLYAYGDVTVQASTIQGNQAEVDGGGAYIPAGPAVIFETVTIIGNKAKSAGGGLAVNAAAGAVELKNVTIADNKALSAASIYTSSTAATTVSNSIIKGVGNCNMAVTAAGYNLESENTCGFGGLNDQTNTDPLLLRAEGLFKGFEEFGGNLYPKVVRLKAGSPAIDTGDNGTCSSGGSDFSPRPIDGDGDGNADCDLGAHEVQ
jgi:hypothetical protein